MLDQITPVVLTRDEETNIARTLGQLTWAREVVLVDSYSSDATLDIARRFPNVRISKREFDTHAAQWSFGLSQVRTNWILALDADYYLPDELISELAALSPGSSICGFRASFRYAIHGQPLRASLYPPRIVLASVIHASFRQDGHTQRLIVHGEIAEVLTPIVHDDRKPSHTFIERQRRYMQAEASKLKTTPWVQLKPVGRLRRLVFFAPVAVLFHTLFVKGLILDGRAGFRYAWERFVAELILSREMLRLH